MHPVGSESYRYLNIFVAIKYFKKLNLFSEIPLNL
jgi:hypothetical protein